MKRIQRREYLKWMSLMAASSAMPMVLRPLSALAQETNPQPVPTESEAAAIAKIARRTLEDHQLPGLSVAVARHGQLVYQQGFGIADTATGKEVTTENLFRIASISKPITSVAIFTLIEQGRLSLKDLVFGEKGILKFDYGESYPEPVTRLTLFHLLTHTAGGWSNSGKLLDPMFCNPAMSHKELITWTLKERALENDLGAHYAYSNFGYCILGRVIEKVTGQAYADYVREAVLKKCGITDMRIGGNTLAERAASEVVYYQQPNDDTSPYKMNVTRMDSHGGWIATPSDLVRFAMHVDGFKTTPNILKADTIKTMTTGSLTNPEYACGWCVNRIPNWWHTGSLPGTATIMVRTASGLCWAAFANARPAGLNLDAMMWKIVRAVPAWHA